MENDKSKFVIIECPNCESKVSAEAIKEEQYFHEWMDTPAKVGLLKCSVCSQILVGHSEMFQTDFDKYEFGNYERLWPSPVSSLSWNLPDLVRKSIVEAELCFSSRAYSACAVMCGRALESLCKERGIKGSLYAGFKELKKKEIIDGRLFEWSEALRQSRNIGAHASDSIISREDAKDMLDFSVAICDYVYVLSDKYLHFKERKLKQAKIKEKNDK